MPEEKERDKVRPKKEGDEPIDDSSQGEGAAGDDKVKNAKKKAKKAQEDVEKYRKRSRERAVKWEEDAGQVRKQHKQEGGE